MKKLFGILLSLILLTTSTAALSDGSALDAFNALTGQQAQANNPAKSNVQYLTEIMGGAYAALPADAAGLTALAGDLQYLSGVTMRDIASFASSNHYPVTQVRNAYYKALANALAADIAVNPAAEEQHRNAQVILSLFLSDDAAADLASREAIRNSMTPATASSIAAAYTLPSAFVEFVIMNEDWEDDRWDNDDDWRVASHWDDTPYQNTDDDLRLGSKDSGGSTVVADLQERLISLGYLTGKADGVFGEQTQTALKQYQLANGLPATGILDDDDIDDFLGANVVARWDYQDSFIDSPNYDLTPDYNTPDYNTPDYNTPDYNTPDYNTPDYNTPDRNSPDDSPDYADS